MSTSKLARERDLNANQHSRAVISPLLANIYLHYVFDLCTHHWRGRLTRGDLTIVRYADDSVLGFESKADVERILEDLKVRFAMFGLAPN